jgi:hypothetical protein
MGKEKQITTFQIKNTTFFLETVMENKKRDETGMTFSETKFKSKIH